MQRLRSSARSCCNRPVGGWGNVSAANEPRPPPPLLSAQDRHCPAASTLQCSPSKRALHAAARCQIASKQAADTKASKPPIQVPPPKLLAAFANAPMPHHSWRCTHKPAASSAKSRMRTRVGLFSDLRMHWRAICLSSYCK